MKIALTIFLCASFLVMPVLAENAVKFNLAKAATAIPSAPSAPDSATELKLQQQKLDFFKERLDLQDKRISDLGIFIALFGTLITAVVVFFSLKSTKEAVQAAKEESRQQTKETLEYWVEKEGTKYLEVLLNPKIEGAIKKIHAAAEPVLEKLAQEAENTRALNQQHEQLRTNSAPNTRTRIYTGAESSGQRNCGTTLFQSTYELSI